MVTKKLRVATYNIHKARGMDGRTRPERIGQVIAELDADVVALQEVLHHAEEPGAGEQLRRIAGSLPGYQMAFAAARLHRGAPYGNAILSRLPLLENQEFDITASRREPRGGQRAAIEIAPGLVLQVFNFHLGTGLWERRRQANLLVSEALLNHPAWMGRRLVLGDFNEWTKGLVTQLLRAHLMAVDLRGAENRARFYRSPFRSYPGWFPMLHLDHIYFDPLLRLCQFRVHRSRLALIASDHVPLIAEFKTEIP
jgi:endonuclease/exonuclease/phosphatase family metal-dependent hydrolase